MFYKLASRLKVSVPISWIRAEYDFPHGVLGEWIELSESKFQVRLWPYLAVYLRYIKPAAYISISCIWKMNNNIVSLSCFGGGKNLQNSSWYVDVAQ